MRLRPRISVQWFPRREWVGLTRKEVMAIINELAGEDAVYLADAIEAKLKEKNT